VSAGGARRLGARSGSRSISAYGVAFRWPVLAAIFQTRGGVALILKAGKLGCADLAGRLRVWCTVGRGVPPRRLASAGARRGMLEEKDLAW